MNGKRIRARAVDRLKRLPTVYLLSLQHLGFNLRVLESKIKSIVVELGWEISKREVYAASLRGKGALSRIRSEQRAM